MMLATLAGGILAITSQSDIGIDSLRISAGACRAESHTASGPEDADLTKRQSPFKCSKMVTTMVDDQPGHFMFQFAGGDRDPIAFAGFINSPDTFRIDRIYFTPGRATEVEDGQCQLFWAKKRLTDVVCGGYVVEAGWKTVAVVRFTPAAA